MFDEVYIESILYSQLHPLLKAGLLADLYEYDEWLLLDTDRGFQIKNIDDEAL